MSMRFVHESHSQRVLFATDGAAAGVAREITGLGVASVMLISSRTEKELAGRVSAGTPVAVHYDDVVMHVPIEVADRARAAAVEHDVDVLLSVGGGSTTGLAKAIALTTGLPIIAVPTTYAGSEATNVWGLTEGAKKTTGIDSRVLPPGDRLRRGADRHVAGGDERGLGAQCPGALRGLDVGAAHRPDRSGDRRGGHPSTAARPAGGGR